MFGVRKPQIAARVAAGICLLTAAFHAALVFGAPWGEYTQGGRMSGSLDAIGRILAAISFVLLCVMACSILARAGEGPFRRLPARAITVLSWFAAVYLLIAVILNLITRSPGERNLWAPVSIVLFLLVAYVMASTRRLPSPSAALGPSGRQ